jgi:hypothetical protein
VGTIQLSRIVSMTDPRSVLAAAESSIRMVWSEINFLPVREAFFAIKDLYEGRYPGYRQCNTGYHDLQHTTDVFLATARLVHGSAEAGNEFSARSVQNCLIAAMMHDSGYIQPESDSEGTGAKYTADHVRRSVNFCNEYLHDRGFAEDDCRACEAMIWCTDLAVKLGGIEFPDSETETMGKILGTADLVGQMADRLYLEKLIFLFYEFQEGQVQGFDSEFDLLKKTIGFYEFVKARMENDLDDMKKYMHFHFLARWNLDEDPYAEGISSHMRYLRDVVANHENDYREFLKRDGLIDRIDEIYGGR